MRDVKDVFLFAAPGLQLIGFVRDGAQDLQLEYPAKVFIHENGAPRFAPVELFPPTGPVTIFKTDWKIIGRPDPTILAAYCAYAEKVGKDEGHPEAGQAVQRHTSS